MYKNYSYRYYSSKYILWVILALSCVSNATENHENERTSETISKRLLHTHISRLLLLSTMNKQVKEKYTRKKQKKQSYKLPKLLNVLG